MCLERNSQKREVPEMTILNALALAYAYFLSSPKIAHVSSTDLYHCENIKIVRPKILFSSE